ncbi:MAG: hypothetical protein AAFR21_04930 [Pseudomonadota bacterium]
MVLTPVVVVLLVFIGLVFCVAGGYLSQCLATKVVGSSRIEKIS